MEIIFWFSMIYINGIAANAYKVMANFFKNSNNGFFFTRKSYLGKF